MRLFMVIAALFIVAGSACADPVTLKCVTSDGQNVADLIIDLEGKMLRWGVSTYGIIHVNDKYISAYRKTIDEVGGEICVIDRRSGEYTRASVAMSFKTGETIEQARLRANTYSGRCVKQQF